MLLALGLILHFLFPLPFLPSLWLQLALGLPLIAISVLLWVWAALTMRRGGTSLNAYEATTAIVTRGPFGFTRNPLYVSLTIVYIGIALAVNALWALILLPIALVGITLGVINQEERYLEQKFGQDYLAYKAKVRRWL